MQLLADLHEAFGRNLRLVRTLGYSLTSALGLPCAPGPPLTDSAPMTSASPTPRPPFALLP